MLYQLISNPLLEDFLHSRNYTIVSATTENAEQLISEERYDMAILEEPENGPTFKYLKLVKQYHASMPVMFVSNKSDFGTILEGFDLGLIDYVAKPCNYFELAARIKAHLGYVTAKAGKTIYKFGHFTLDMQKLSLTFKDKVLPVKESEARILGVLCAQEGELCTRKHILETLWGSINYFNSRSLDVSLVYIRKMLAYDPRVQLINIRKQGYKLITQDEAEEPEIIEIKKGAE